MSQSVLRKSDVVSGLLLVFLGLSVAVAALQMSRPEDVSPLVAYLTYPGSVPLLLGILIIVCGLAVSWKGYRTARGPGREELRALARALGSPSGRRGLAVVALFAIYATTLIALFPFWLATLAYLTVLMFVLQSTRWWIILITAFAVSVGLHLFFGSLLNLPLP